MVGISTTDGCNGGTTGEGGVSATDGERGWHHRRYGALEAQGHFETHCDQPPDPGQPWKALVGALEGEGARHVVPAPKMQAVGGLVDPGVGEGQARVRVLPWRDRGWRVDQAGDRNPLFSWRARSPSIRGVEKAAGAVLAVATRLGGIATVLEGPEDA